MKNFFIILLIAVVFSACSNPHIRFTNGAVVTEERNTMGVIQSVQVDTTNDGVADVMAYIDSYDKEHQFSKGEIVSLDIRERNVYATPILQEKVQTREAE
jgi:hypothetical protein